MRVPDVDGMVRSFLMGHVSVPVHVSVPKDRPVSFVVARRNGGFAVNRILDSPNVTVDCWAPSGVEAAELAEDCRSAFLHEYAGMPLVRGVSEVSGPYSVPDVESGSPRYRFTVQLSVRAAR